MNTELEKLKNKHHDIETWSIEDFEQVIFDLKFSIADITEQLDVKFGDDDWEVGAKRCRYHQKQELMFLNRQYAWATKKSADQKKIKNLKMQISNLTNRLARQKEEHEREIARLDNYAEKQKRNRLAVIDYIGIDKYSDICNKLETMQ